MPISEQEVLAADAARRAALLAADRTALDLLLAEEFRYVHASGKVEFKDQYLVSITPGTPKFLSFAVRDTLVHVYGDVAVEGGAILLTRAEQDGMLTKEHQFTAVWVKKGSALQLTTFQNSSKSKA